MELSELLHEPAWTEAVVKYGELHAIKDPEERRKVAPESMGHGGGVRREKGIGNVQGGSDILAYAGALRKNKRLLTMARKVLLSPEFMRQMKKSLAWPDSRRMAYWGRMAISVIAMCERRK